MRLLDLDKGKIDRKLQRKEKCQPIEEDKEIYVIIANELLKSGVDISGIRLYRNSSGYVDVLEKNTILKFKIGK